MRHSQIKTNLHQCDQSHTNFKNLTPPPTFKKLTSPTLCKEIIILYDLHFPCRQCEESFLHTWIRLTHAYSYISSRPALHASSPFPRKKTLCAFHFSVSRPRGICVYLRAPNSSLPEHSGVSTRSIWTSTEVAVTDALWAAFTTQEFLILGKFVLV